MRLMVLAAAACLIATTAAAQVVEQPCPPPLPEPAAVAALRVQTLDPVSTGVDRQAAAADPDAQAYRKVQGERARQDWAALCRYRAANAAVAGPVRAVFMGDSLTEYWADADPDFFAANHFAGRGVAGQVSAQGLVRFEADVVALKPRVVHIMMGTNDIGGLGGPTTLAAIQDNIRAMVQLARANRIGVVLATITPALDYPWRTGMAPAAKIRALNGWIRAYAKAEGLVLVDYYPLLASPEGGMKAGLSADGVHANRTGYALMKPLALAAIARAAR